MTTPFPQRGPVAGPSPARTPHRRAQSRGALDLLLQRRSTILAAAAMALLAGALYLALAARTYRADALLQLDTRGRVALAGIDDAGPAVAGTPALTEIELLRSRAVLGEAVEKLHLDLLAEPHHAPIVGRAVARWRRGAGVAAGPGGFAWGGERIAVERLEVPAGWVGKELRLTALPGGRFELRGPEGKVLAGQVGKLLEQGELRLLVSALEAAPGTRFRLARRSLPKLLAELQGQLAIAEKGTGTGVVRVAAAAPSPELAAALANEVARAYVRQDEEQRAALVERSLRFVNGQLPALKADMDKAEAALNEYRARRGAALDLSMEAKSVLDRLASVEQALNEVELQRPELRQRFTADHPTLLALDAKSARLRAERATLERKVQSLPETELRLAQLTRNAKVAGDLYVLLLQKAQELKVAHADREKSVRLVDAALVPDQPDGPRPASTLGGALLLGLALGAGWTLLRAAVLRRVEDARALEAAVELPVYATVPRSRTMARLARAARRPPSEEQPLLALDRPEDPAVEAVRSLRTQLLLALSDEGSNVVAVTGVAPGEGASFTAANLALVSADAGKRVLLVDADLRRGALHAHFGAQAGPGLSEVVRGGQEPKAAVRVTGTPNLSLLPRGERVADPSELLGGPRFHALVEWAARAYDLVVIDTAPVLAVADAAHVGRAATTLLVVRAGAHGIDEVDEAVGRAREHGMRLRALVLNGASDAAVAAGARRYRYD